MGNLPVLETHDASHNAATKQEKEKKGKRQIHPIRRVARLILGSGARPKKEDVRRLGDELEEGKTCHGASRWQNVLPFLEPLFALDPKLSFIEDRILGQTPTTSHDDVAFTVPKDLAELEARVEEADLPCTCDECAPKLYKISTLASHGVIDDRRNGSLHTHDSKHARKFSYQNDPQTFGMGPQLGLKFHGTYEAMTLVRHHMAWLDATYLHPSARPTPSVHHLRSLIATWHPHMTAPDLRASLSTSQLNDLFAHLNRVFFSDCVPPHNKMLSAGFRYLDARQTECFGKSFYNPIVGTQVLLHPVLYRGCFQHQHLSHHGSLDPTMQRRQQQQLATRLHNRLGTLLHEMCHAFLKAYTCRSCPMHDSCIGPRGHGRAWQMLAKKMEQVATVVLGGAVDMGRFPSLLRDCEGSGRLPSVHDLEVFGMNGRGSVGRNEAVSKGGGGGGGGGGEEMTIRSVG